MKNYYLILILISSFCFTLLAINYLLRNTKYFSLIDTPSSRIKHNYSIPVIGGLSIFICICLFLLFSLLFFQNYDLDIFKLVSIVFITLIIFLMGIYDDFVGLKTYKKIIIQLISTLILISILNIDEIIIFDIFSNYYFNLFLIVCFILGIMNSINLIDGIDGLAGGISIIIVIAFIIINLLFSFWTELNSFLFMLLGSLFAFILYNLNPAKIYLGDSGSLLLGWIFAFISIFYIDNISLKPAVFLPFIILSLPALDVLFIMFNRFRTTTTTTTTLDRIKSVFMPDNSHIHHMFLDAGISEIYINIMLYLYCIIVSSLAIFTLVYQLNLIYNMLIVFFLFVLIRQLPNIFDKKQL